MVVDDVTGELGRRAKDMKGMRMETRRRRARARVIALCIERDELPTRVGRADECGGVERLERALGVRRRRSGRLLSRRLLACAGAVALLTTARLHAVRWPERV